MEENEKSIVGLFEYFYSRLYKTSYKLNLDLNNQAQLLKNFSKILYKKYIPQTIGINFLIDYFSFAFTYYGTKKLKRNIAFNWIASKRLLKRYIERVDGTDHYTKLFLRENNINLDDLRSSLVEQESIDPLKLDPVEELVKGRLADTDARLYRCLNDTTLFNHRSVCCISCSQRILCKKLLQQTNPIVFKKRGYV